MKKRPINIKGISKIEILKVLYEHANRPPSMKEDFPVTSDMCYNRLKTDDYDVDTFCGKYLHVNLQGDTFDPTEYDAINGDGKAAEALSTIFHKGGKS